MTNFFWLMCPQCEWDCIEGDPEIGDLGLMCPVCTSDVPLETQNEPLPERVEGWDARQIGPRPIIEDYDVFDGDD